MQKDNLHNFVQVSTTLALLVGVALVVYELRQTRDLASSNFQSETLIARIAGFQAIGGESFADAIANVCTSTDSLSAKDLVVLDAYFDQHYLHESIYINVAFFDSRDTVRRIIELYSSETKMLH